MILGVGTDITSISRVADILAAHDTRFIERCFAKVEKDKVEKTSNGDHTLRAAGYAKRWAAKEACAKALGTGIRESVFLKDIVVVNDDQGQPALALQGGAAEKLNALIPAGMQPHLHVSISDEMPMALAFVVISAGPI